MEGDGEGGASGHDKLHMCLILCVFVCERGERVTSYFTRLNNFDKQWFLNKSWRGSKVSPKSINQSIISHADKSRVKVEKHLMNANSKIILNMAFMMKLQH